MHEDNGREITISFIRDGEAINRVHCKDTQMAITVARGILARMRDLQPGDLLIAEWRQPNLISQGLG
jgi:hypothetical protein